MVTLLDLQYLKTHFYLNLLIFFHVDFNTLGFKEYAKEIISTDRLMRI